jgi:hypothetical protein
MRRGLPFSFFPSTDTGHEVATLLGKEFLSWRENFTKKPTGRVGFSKNHFAPKRMDSEEKGDIDVDIVVKKSLQRTLDKIAEEQSTHSIPFHSFQLRWDSGLDLEIHHSHLIGSFVVCFVQTFNWTRMRPLRFFSCC